MKNRYFYNGNLINALKTFGICKVMSDLVFPYYGMKNACEENEIDEDCATCMALYALWLDAEASPDLQLKTAKDDDCGCGGDCKCKSKKLEYDYINDAGIPVLIDEHGYHYSATTGEVLIDPDEQKEYEVEKEDKVLFHKETFETGEVGIRCASYEDAVSLCHILKNMGYKGADLERPEEYTNGSFYTYGKHDNSVFLFDVSFISYFEGTSGKKIDEEFILLDYDKIDFLPKETEAPEEPQGMFRDPIFPIMLGGLEGFGLGIL